MLGPPGPNSTLKSRFIINCRLGQYLSDKGSENDISDKELFNRKHNLFRPDGVWLSGRSFCYALREERFKR